MALLGRNGAGKCTTMKAIAGLAPPRRGTVTLLGRDVTGWKPYHIARAGLGFVPEDRQVFPEHTVEDNLLIATQEGSRRPGRMAASSASTTSFRCWSRCATAWPAGCRAASSRCWRSPAR